MWQFHWSVLSYLATLESTLIIFPRRSSHKVLVHTPLQTTWLYLNGYWLDENESTLAIWRGSGGRWYFRMIEYIVSYSTTQSLWLARLFALKPLPSNWFLRLAQTQLWSRMISSWLDRLRAVEGQMFASRIYFREYIVSIECFHTLQTQFTQLFRLSASCLSACHWRCQYYGFRR